MCYKKKEFEHKRESSPTAHQLKIGTAYTKYELCGQSEESSSGDSFCPQVKLKSTQAETRVPHLITNLAYKLKPYKKTQYLRARLDTCTDVNILPVSIYKLIFRDTDCKKLAPSNKVEIGTYTTDKIKIIGSCEILAVHPDTQDLKEVTFHVTSHEGSVVSSCATTLELGLIQPCENLDFIPSCASLISSTADHPGKNRSQMKHSHTRCSSKGQSHSVVKSKEYHVNQCVPQEDKDKPSKQEYQAHVNTMDDMNCQSTLGSDKDCQDTNMQPVKPGRKSSHMWSVTKSSNMQSVAPEILQSSSKQKNPVKQGFVCDDKNCQSTKLMWPVKPARESSHM